MKMIHLQIDDTILEKVMTFLTDLPKQNIHVEIEETPVSKNRRQLTALSIQTKNFKFNRNEAHER